ncbi:MAG TPA: MBL fold metallo-hydrolase [Cyclobacteriaceae bacterium]|nr:MBL fold metallo-hydrolase [Cyclobacteriaceae bacterium]
MKLHVIDTGFFKLDGGAMFGVVPKTIWEKTNPPDANNLCTWAMRCLLIEDGNRLILIDNGIGDKQDAKFLSYYYLHGEDSLIKSIRRAGFSESDITDMFITHLHFDHCGGGVKRNGEGFALTFPNATYWSNEDHWQWATKPNAREKASFLKENILPIQESGHLKMVRPQEASPFPQMEIFYVSGHTDKMMIPMIQYKGRTICFVADLIPSASHIPVPYVMGYDTRPLITMEEKERFLKEAAEKKYVLYFEHDPLIECCTVAAVDGRVRLENKFRLSEL